MDRAFGQPLDVPHLARIAEVSEAHFSRTFRTMFFLRSTDRSVTDICFDVGFTSLGTFSRTFHAVVGESQRPFASAGVWRRNATRRKQNRSDEKPSDAPRPQDCHVA
jgi:transcriptional regulator GlxA family with amidase domain